MNEDTELTAFVKGRLEEGASKEPPGLAALERLAADESFAAMAERRSRRRLWGASLVAASLAAVCAFAVLIVAPHPAPERTVACVIDLLRASDGDDGESGADTVAELLLAWQDAPYESAVHGLLADSAN